MDYRKIIETWRLNKSFIAEKIGMKLSTFNNKYSITNSLYHFTLPEEYKIIQTILEMRDYIDKELLTSYENE